MAAPKECVSEENTAAFEALLTLKECHSRTHGVVVKDANQTEESLKDTNAANDLRKDVGTTAETNKSTVGSDPPRRDMSGADGSRVDPAVGMAFRSEEEAYNFYNSYAKRKGFSVRKGHLSRRKDGSVRDRHFLCSNEGTRQPHRTHVTKKPRPLERTNCSARIEFKVNNDNVWVANKFFEEHNHPLASPNKIFMLRSHRRKFPLERPVFTESDYYYGVKPSPVQELQPEETPNPDAVGVFLRNQSCCSSSNRLRDLEKGDAQFLLDFLKAKQSEDPSFFYAVQLDEKERLTNCFWTDACSISDYVYFGDAVSFETTYRSSRFDLPVALFTGINHHKQILIFGAALLLDETVESFVWLFKTFLAAMSGRQPKTILTDHLAAMSKAIDVSLPDTCHRFCLWHILHNASRHVHSAFNGEPTFRKEFENIIYGEGPEDEFHKRWDNMINEYGLSTISWLNDLYTVREKWSLAHRSNSFCGTMTTKKWSESMDNLFKIHFYRKLSLTKFLVQYFKSLTQLREKEFHEDHDSRQTKPVLLVDIPMLAGAAESYTKTIYADFEYEYKNQLACVCEAVAVNGAVYTFKVSVPQKRSSGLVNFNPSDATIACSCKKFESMGILCLHALKVLNNNNILYLPSQYILKRWTKHAKDERVPGEHRPVVSSGVQESLCSRYSRVCRKAAAVAVKSSLSRDALEVLEHGLDRFLEEVESLLHNGPFCKQTNEKNVPDEIMHNPIEGSNICFDGFDFAAR